MIFGILMLLVLWGGYLAISSYWERRVAIDIHYQPRDLSKQNVENFRFLSYRQAQIAQLGILTSIQALLGAFIGVFYGPLQMLWIVVGTLLLSGGINYLSGLYSVRNSGKTCIYAIREKNERLYRILCMFLVAASIIGAAGVCLTTYYISFVSLKYSPVIYFYFAIMLLVAFCSQRRFNILAMFAGGYIVFTTIYFVLLSLPELPNAMVHFDAETYPQIKFFYPMLFFSVCGVLSGMEALKCSLIAPAVKNEKMAKGVYFGSSVLLAGLMIVWALLFLAWNPDIRILAQSLYKFQYPYQLIDATFLIHYNRFSYTIFYIMIIVLCVASGGVLLRVARQLIDESGVMKKYSIEYAIVETFIAMILVYAFLSGINYFEIINMFVACIWLGFIAKNSSRRLEYVIIIAFLLGASVAQILLVDLLSTPATAISSGICFSILLLCAYYVYIKKFKDRIKIWND